jgi:hypothetical protein
LERRWLSLSVVILYKSLNGFLKFCPVPAEAESSPVLSNLHPDSDTVSIHIQKIRSQVGLASYFFCLPPIPAVLKRLQACTLLKAECPSKRKMRARPEPATSGSSRVHTCAHQYLLSAQQRQSEITGALKITGIDRDTRPPLKCQASSSRHQNHQTAKESRPMWRLPRPGN